MSRKPPLPVQRILRQEVSFGCPVDGCRQPFLSWHHFAPPWSERQHHEPEGMIALCRPHHDFADGGGFSNSELRALKSGDYSEESVMANFPWAKKALLIRLGGNYSGGTSSVLSIGGEPIVQLISTSRGLLQLSFVLNSPEGAVAASMVENMFQSDPASLHDLSCTVGAKSVTVWFGQRDIGLKLSFNRMTMDGLSDLLVSDRKRAENNPAAKRTQEELGRFMGEFRHGTDRAGAPSRQTSSALPSRDLAGLAIKEWASANCLDEDGRLTLIDFENISLHAGGRHVRIRNGITEGSLYIGYSALLGNGGSFNL